MRVSWKHLFWGALIIAVTTRLSSKAHTCQDAHAELVEYSPINLEECLYTYAWTDNTHTYFDHVTLKCRMTMNQYGSVYYVPETDYPLSGCFFDALPEKYMLYA